MKNTKVGSYFYNDEALNFEFATTLSASDKITFVNSVVDTIVDDNYHSTIRNMMFDYMLIRVCSDVDVSFIQNSKDTVDAIEQFLEETNIVDVIKANMEDGLLEELNEAVNLSVRYRTGIHPSPLNDALASLLSTLENKVNEIDLGNAMEMVQKFVGMTDEFTSESIVNAYMNSDTHQNNVVEIEKTKKNKKSKKNEIKIDENLGEAIRAIVEEDKAEDNSEK